MSAPTDDAMREWLPRARAGEADALGQVLGYVDTSFESVARQYRRRNAVVAALEETGDLFQEALLKLSRRYTKDRDSIPEDPAQLRIDVLLSLRNVRIDLVRKHRGPHGLAQNVAGPVIVEPANDGTSVSARLMRDEERESVLAAVENLPPELREVIELYYLGEGLTQIAIANLLCVSRKTVGRRLLAAMSQLQSQLT